MDICLSILWEMVEDQAVWRAAVHRVAKSCMLLSDQQKEGVFLIFFFFWLGVDTIWNLQHQNDKWSLGSNYKQFLECLT